MPRPKNEKLHLLEKRQEIIFALDSQGYNGAEIATIFSVSRSVVNRIIAVKPKKYEPKWIKVQQ